MRNYPNGLSLAVALSLGFASHCAVAQNYASFGDNIADPGNIPGIIDAYNRANGTQFDPNFPPSPPGNGNRYSNGPTAAELLPNLVDFGFGDVQHRAVGNAFSAQLPVSLAGGILLGNGSSIPGPIGRGLIPLNNSDIASQVAQYLSSTGPLGLRDLMLLYPSGNDAALALNTIALTNPSQADAVQIVVSGAIVNAQNTANSAALLLGAGAGTVLVSNLPNIGRTPAALSGGLSGQALATLFSTSTNTALSAALATLDGGNRTLIIADSFTLTNDIVANPGKYGFTNVTTPCSLLPSCVSAGRNVQDQFLFWDAFFPTARAHAISAAFLADTVNAPRTLPALSEEGRYANERFVGQQLGLQGEGVWVDLEYGANTRRRESTPFAAGYESSGESVDARVGWTSDNGLTLGATLGIGSADIDYRSVSGGFDHERRSLGLFATWQRGDWRLSAAGGYSDDDFDDLVRNTGVANQQSRADTDGDSRAALVEARWTHALTAASTWSPFLRLGYSDGKVSSFVESGATGLSQSAQALDLDGSFAELGATLSADIGPLTGSLTGAYHQQIGDSDQRVRSALVTLSDFTRQARVDAPDDDYARVEVSLHGPISKNWRLGVNASTTFAESNLGEQSGSIWVQLKF